SMFRHFGVMGRDYKLATDLADDQALYDLIRKSLDEGRVVTSGTFDGPEEAKKKAAKLARGLLHPKAPAPHVDHPMPDGTIPSPEYTVLGVTTTRDPQTGQVERWLKLRNPWGDSVPTADPNAPKLEGANAGVFYMKVSSYRKAFEDLTIQQYATD